MSSKAKRKSGSGASGAVQMPRLEIERDGQISFVTYSVSEEGRLTLWHTEVPEKLRGSGIGGELVQQALALAHERRLSIEPVCPFSRDYLSRHPELATSARQ